MHVHSRLTRGLAHVDSDVVTVGRMLGTNEPLGLAKKLEYRDLFLGRHLKEVGHVAFRNDEDVTTTQ